MKLKFSEEEVRNAYIRLKTHIYYDTSDLLIRRRLAEFETNLKENYGDGSKEEKEEKEEGNSWFKSIIGKSIDEKLKKITKSLNDTDEDFFKQFLDKLDIKFFPKKFKSEHLPSNFISNQRERKEYEIERGSAFIDIPIELHIITVLWVIRYGKELDSTLSDNAYGNRLLLNQDKDNLLEGSSLFKRYYKQYQKWRDNAVETAKNTLENNEDVLFLNLDIKDYYYSTNINLNTLIQEQNFLTKIFNEIHTKYTEKLKALNFPFSYNDKLEDNEVVLPIGLLSSYILGNYFLKEFDDKIIKQIKPIYYGRYVDDILFVIKNPNCTENTNNKDVTELIASELKDVFTSKEEEEENEFQLKFKDNKYENLCIQSEKTLIYFFDHKESELVIKKLKRELDERASEFRDLPAENNSKTFEDCAYHLIYDGSEGKIKTLKDYKENRFGLSVFLSNKIFSAIRHNKKLNTEESKQILKFFKGINCLDSFRLWEKILTFFMANDDPKSFVDFYIHAFNEINKIKHSLFNENYLSSLQEYLDCATEMTLALNPLFLDRNKIEYKNFTFFQNREKEWYKYVVGNYPSYHINRFRLSNLVRHHYVIQPLANFTNIVKDKNHNLTNIDLPLNSLEFRDNAIDYSPRPVKFWECCIAIINKKLSEKQSELQNEKDDLNIDVFNLKDDEDNSDSDPFYLDEAYELYKKINKIHLPKHILEYGDFKKSFYKYSKDKKNTECDLIEFQINKKNKLDKIRISFANTKIEPENIERSVRGIPNINADRYNTFQKNLKQTREENSNILLLPENALPYQLLSSLANFSCKNSIMSISGLEHWKVENYVFNFIVNIMPVTVNNTKDAVVLIRLKNHYAPSEKELIRSEHLFCPKPQKYRYDIINWRNLYFSTFYCFELANCFHRSLFKSKVDMLVASEWNKDIPYYSNIVESLSRDVHAYIAQVNTSQYGDSRLTKPSSTATKDILKLKGGINDSVLIGEIKLDSLRNFQRKNYNHTKDDKEFKPLPPDYNYQNAIKRENNESILDE